MTVNLLALKISIELTPKWHVLILKDLARFIDGLGFDTIWVSDHYHNRNVFVVLAVIASATCRVKLGPGVLSPYLHHPAYIAQSILTLVDLAKGRVVCGIGAGDFLSLMQLGFKRLKPVSVVRDALLSIKTLISGNSTNIYNPAFKLINAKLNFGDRNNVPIYVGAQGDEMLKMAARYADGILVNFSDEEMLGYAYNLVCRTITDAGRDASSIDVAAYTSVSISDDTSSAKKAALSYAAYILAGSNDKILERLGISMEKASKIRSAIMQMDLQQAKSLVEDEVDKFAIYGTPAHVTDKLLSIRSIGYEHIVIGSPIGPDLQKAMALLNTEVLPRLRDE